MKPVTAIRNVTFHQVPGIMQPPRLRAEVVDDHSKRFKKGDTITTSPIHSIDFERGLVTTRSGTIYLFPQEEFGL